jgi:hypothetical protein
MALLATTFTVEIILLIIGLYLFDGGIIRKFGAIGLFIFGLQLSYSAQTYVSDATTLPTNVSLFFTPEIQRAMVFMFALLTLVTIAWTFVELAKIVKFKGNGGDLKDVLEELV